jgi:hypothetical protein
VSGLKPCGTQPFARWRVAVDVRGEADDDLARVARVDARRRVVRGPEERVLRLDLLGDAGRAFGLVLVGDAVGPVVIVGDLDGGGEVVAAVGRLGQQDLAAVVDAGRGAIALAGTARAGEVEVVPHDVQSPVGRRERLRELVLVARALRRRRAWSLVHRALVVLTSLGVLNVSP